MSNGSEFGIAVIGMSGRFPGADDVNTLWRNLEAGIESIRFFSDSELLSAGIEPKLLAHPNYVKARGCLDHVDLFDAEFFGFTAREAQIANPEQRLFLECAWEALESAGYPPWTHDRLTGVFGSASTNTYWQHFYPMVEQGVISPFQLAIGNDKDYLPTRVSYRLNLRGPSIAVQTACSSSLVAVHLACQALLAGDCELALAGGASIGIPSRIGYLFEEGNINSRDGHCRVFDAQSTGTVRSDGVGIVLLKRLADALADGDQIWAVIMGSAINNDGDEKVGYTAPSVTGQADVIRSAHDIAGVDPDTIGYIECHGTGTSLGDPIEIAALTKAFFAGGVARRKYCAVGSIKSNIGHLDVTAGVVGLIKAVMAVHHGLIPKTLHFTRPNPQIDFENSPFYVPGKSIFWKSNGAPRRAGVSSFGIGGTNAHVVLEQAPQIEKRRSSRHYYLLPVSARTAQALERQTTSLCQLLKSDARADISDIAYTLQKGRNEFENRRVFLCKDKDAPIVNTIDARPARGERTVVFMFPGQGVQHLNMGRGLYETEEVFRAELDRCANASRPILGLDFRDLLYAKSTKDDERQRRLNDTDIVQPMLFAVEYALARLWMSRGIRPSVMIGHSIGEYVAACVACVLTPEDAVTLVTIRGRLMQQMLPGAMMALPLSEDKVLEMLPPELSLAAINGPADVVVSGTAEAIDRFQQDLRADGIEAQRLRTARAFHSQMVAPILENFRNAIEGIRLSAPEIPYISNVTGREIEADSATDPDYWVRQARQTVRFWPGILTIGVESARVFLEVGPGRSLSAPLRRYKSNSASLVFTSLPHVSELDSDEPHFLSTLAELWVNGMSVDWAGAPTQKDGRRIPLPTYPFERQSYWFESGAKPVPAGRPKSGSEVAPGVRLYVPSWKRSAHVPALEEPLPPHLRSCALLMDKAGLGARIACRLRRLGAEVTEIEAGDRLEDRSGTLTIQPDQRDHYVELVRRLTRTKFPSTLVHLWNLVGKTDSTPADGDLGQHRTSLGLMYLAQAMASQQVFQPVRLVLVSNDAQFVYGNERFQPGAATMFGAAPVISQEYKNFSCRLLDLGIRSWRDEELDAASDQIVAELATASRDLAAYRGNRRWVRDFEPLDISYGNTLPRSGGVYLITGGVGRIGCALAGYLIRKYGARVALTTRMQFPEQAEWAASAASPGDPEMQKRLDSLRSIQDCWGSLLVLQADAADDEQTHQAIKRTEETFGQLNGVIHAAGVTGPKSLCEVRNTGEAEAMLQWPPKIHGLLALDRALGARQLDFRVAMSSLASILGGLGFALYAAGNAFMDAFAQASWSNGSRRWIAVNWDGWRFEGPWANSTNSGALNAMLPYDQGLEVFETILSSSREPQVIVSMTDLHERLRRSTAPADTGPACSSEIPVVDSRSFDSQLERTLAGIWCQLLGASDITANDNFFVRGGDSLVAMRLISRIRELFRIDVPVRMAFEAPSIASMAKFIRQYEQSPGRSENIASVLNSDSSRELHIQA